MFLEKILKNDKCMERLENTRSGRAKLVPPFVAEAFFLPSHLLFLKTKLGGGCDSPVSVVKIKFKKNTVDKLLSYVPNNFDGDNAYK